MAVFSRAPPVEEKAKAKKTQRSKSFHAPSEKRFWAPQVSRGRVAEKQYTKIEIVILKK